MGQFVIACYRPKAGQEKALRREISRHEPTLREQGLISDRSAYVMQAGDGIILEVFEWRSAEAVEAAHDNPVVQAMWDRFAACCDYVTLADLAESAQLFAHFEPVDPNSTPAVD